MATNHISPYVQDGIAGFRVVYRHFIPNSPYKSNSVSTLRFPICDGVTEEEAWRRANCAANHAYRENFQGIPKVPKVDWKAMGQTRVVSETALREEKKLEAEKLNAMGYSTRRIAKEVGVGHATVARWRKTWK